MTSAPFQPGAIVELAPAVQRVVAPNPGPMTGPGTNTYVLGEGQLAVIDPGPDVPAHLDALLAIPGSIRWIFVTHTHRDHSPAAATLAAKTQARLLGMPPPGSGPQDRSFHPDTILSDGQRIVLNGLTLEAVHTPGHASNHLCYRLVELDWLFTGDHIMGGSTVVIAPPDGNMGQYLQSLKRLKDLGLKALIPGHGAVIDDPLKEVDALIAHRLGRERKVYEAVAAESGSLDRLVVTVYDDVSPSLHSVARLSLLAHLQKLQEDGRVELQGDLWQTV